MSNWMKNTRTWLGLDSEPYYEDEYGDPDDEYLDEDEEYYDDAPVPPTRDGSVIGSEESTRTIS